MVGVGGCVHPVVVRVSTRRNDPFVALQRPEISSAIYPVRYLRKSRRDPDRLHAKTTDRTDARMPVVPSLGPPTSEGRPIEPEIDYGQQKQAALPEEDVLNSKDGGAPVDNGGQDAVSASPEEIQAALLIADAYHRVITRKKEVPKGINASRARFWSHFRDRASSMEWSSYKRYKMLMLGPLVHVLVCLDCIKMFADYINKDSKKQLRGDDHSRLEELMERSDRSR